MESFNLTSFLRIQADEASIRSTVNTIRSALGNVNVNVGVNANGAAGLSQVTNHLNNIRRASQEAASATEQFGNVVGRVTQRALAFGLVGTAVFATVRALHEGV